MRNVFRPAVGLLIGIVQIGLAQPDVPTTNMRAYQFLAGKIGDSLNAQLPAGDTSRVLLSVKPEGTAWLVQGSIGDVLQQSGHKVVVNLPAVYQADLGIVEMHVGYVDVRTDGMFGGKLVDREVVLNMETRLIDQRSGVVMLSRQFRQELHDTVSLSAVQTLEDANVPVTQGTVPGEGFFTSLVEPLIMLGAVAVAVYLLFTVRS